MREPPILFLVVALSACAGGSTGAGPTQPPPAQLPTAQPQPARPSLSQPNAVASDGCGPADGSAIQVVILDQVASCAAVKTAAPRATIGIWSGTLPEGASLRLDGNGGSASLCDRGECQPIKGAELVVSGLRGDGWSGVLRWTDATGPHELPIWAIECPSEPIQCG
jgi:hypothetical protein